MKTITTILITLISVSGLAQTKDTTTKQKLYYLNLALPESKWIELVNMIRTADEKPSVVSQWVQLIQQNAKEIIQDSTKKK